MISGVGHMSHVPCPFTETLPMTISPRYQTLICIHIFLSYVSTQVTRVGNAPDTLGIHAIHILIPLEVTCLH